jgi:hypothetical protein
MFSSKYSRQTGKGQGFLVRDEELKALLSLLLSHWNSYVCLMEQLEISSGSHNET